MKKYLLTMFFLCFFVWGVIVDNVILPSPDSLKQDNGVFTRYKVKSWDTGAKYGIIDDQLMIYAIVDNREQLYYITRNNYFENTLKRIPEGTAIQLRYTNRFPKFWKRQVYDLRERGISIMSYSVPQLNQEQKEIWKISGIMTGVFLALAVVGWIGRPRNR